MNHSLLHKLLGITFLIGVILAFVTPSQAAERTRQLNADGTGAGLIFPKGRAG